MTKLSVSSQRRFMSAARSVFPWDKFFDPKDYLVEFNRNSKFDLGLLTFKKYLSIVSKSPMFPELFRDRNSGAEGFYYFLDPTDKTKITLPKAKVSSPKSAVSEQRLLDFAYRVAQVCRGGKWYSSKTLWRKYNNTIEHTVGGQKPRYRLKKLQHKTFSSYMALALQNNLWEGLSRKKGSGRLYKYYWPKSGEEAVTVTPVPQSGRTGESIAASLVAPDSGSSETSPGWVPTKEDPKACSCGSWNPYEAKFCMNCGSTFGTCLKVIVQESVFDLRIMWKDEFLKDVERVKAHVKNLVCQKLLVFVDDMDGAGLLATVSLVKNQERKEMKKKGGS